MRTGRQRERSPVLAARADPVRGDSLHARPVRGRGRRSRCAGSTQLFGHRRVRARSGHIRRRRQRAGDARAAARLRALAAAPGAHAHGPGRGPGPAGVLGRERQAARVRRGQYPRGRAGRHGRDDAGDPRPGDSALRHERHGRRAARPCHRRRHPDHEPGRSGGRTTTEREPLRPEPGPARPVAGGDARQHRLPARLAGPGRAVHARLLQPDPGRRAHEAAQPGARVRQVPLLEPAPAGRQRSGDRGDRPKHPAAGQPVGRSAA